MIMIQYSNQTSQKIQKSQNSSSEIQKKVLELTQLIASQTNTQTLSAMYTNRGVLYYQLLKYQWAQSDFQKGTNLNHLNYAAYFNMFSVSICDNNNLEGLKNLCCALSCLYLLRGELRDNQSDISKCLKLAENNQQGRLLRTLQYRKKGKYSLALNELQWLLDSQPMNKQYLHIQNILQSLIKKQSISKGILNQGIQSNTSISQKSIKYRNKRLVCTIYDELSQNQSIDYLNQIEKKLAQFNQIINELNHNKIGKETRNIYNIFILNDTNVLKQSISRNPVQTRQQEIVSQDNLLASQHKIQNNKEQLNQYLIPLQKIYQEDDNDNDNDNDNENQNQNQYEITSSFQKPTQIQNNLKKIQSRQSPKQKISLNDSQQRSDLLIQSGTQLQSGLESYLVGSGKRSGKSKSGLSNSSNSFVTVQAQNQDSQIHIKIQNIQLLSQAQIQKDKLKSLYCHFDFGQKSRNSKQKQGSQLGKILKVKLFNKQILAFKDLMLGQGEIQVAHSGSYQVSIYKDKQKTEQVSQIKLYIQI